MEHKAFSVITGAAIYWMFIMDLINTIIMGPLINTNVYYGPCLYTTNSLDFHNNPIKHC